MRVEFCRVDTFSEKERRTMCDDDQEKIEVTFEVTFGVMYK